MKTKPIFNGDTIELTDAPNTMSSVFVKKLIDNYRDNQLVAINTKFGIQDAHSIRFDLTTLKKFISDIENEAQKVNPAITENDLGVRFYYAAYPQANNWDIMEDTPIGTNYAGKHTLVMIPTLKMGNAEGEILSYDFNPLDASTYNQNNDNDGEQEEVMAMNKALTAVLCQNHGNLIPPDDKKVEEY
ncbi:hypothetical protein A0O34_06205 [Chryseobacterium glaciei]|uniref:Uncharacterized protein n=1 Tax=Chryseobacterium glaciei TaxID=1685010 RepID=A0A172XT93_9FLAO|nr:hypothetical protein [Chryseobacterium glaciei]ANF50126.1 hypothetical protein A0O34_06205 [Chryseobacterium glaciei]